MYVAYIIFLLNGAGLGNSIFVASIFNDYIRTRGIFYIIAFLPITGEGLTT